MQIPARQLLITIFSSLFFVSACIADELETILNFINNTPHTITETKPPFLDNAASFSCTSFDYHKFPESLLEPNQQTTAIGLGV